MFGRKKASELYKAHDFCKSGQAKLTVIFLHGIASDSSSYFKALQYLEGTSSMKDVRFVAFDLLGAGKSYTSDKLEYTIDEQNEALENSIKKLNAGAPIVLVGHSMGTMLLANYLATHKRGIKKAVLISPPIYRKEEIEHPAFAQAMENFKLAVKQRNSEMVKTKCFNNEIKNIVMNIKNYDRFLKLTRPTVMIYGEEDKIIAPQNIMAVAKQNPNVEVCKTSDGHGVSHDKYIKLLRILEETINETI